MKDVLLEVPSTSFSENSIASVDADRKVWNFEIPIGTASYGPHTIEIDGHDIAGSPLQGFDSKDEIAGTDIIKRTEDGSWEYPGNLVSKVHQFKVINEQPEILKGYIFNRGNTFLPQTPTPVFNTNSFNFLEVDANNSIWAATTDNAGGLYIFDGCSWEVIKNTNNQTFDRFKTRTMKRDPNTNSIWIGMSQNLPCIGQTGGFTFLAIKIIMNVICHLRMLYPPS